MLKIKIDFDTFFEKGIKNYKDDFMISLINGYQGSGKSYYGIYMLEKDFKSRVVYTNIKSYHSPIHDVHYFTKIEELYNNHVKNAIFLIDELSKKYTKDSPIDKPFYSWLQQSRKHSRYVYMITQEYKQVPPWLRGVANTSYTTSKVPLTPFMYTILGIPTLNPDTCEWELDELSIRIYKRTFKYASLYDTFEIIDSL